MVKREYVSPAVHVLQSCVILGTSTELFNGLVKIFITDVYSSRENVFQPGITLQLVLFFLILFERELLVMEHGSRTFHYRLENTIYGTQDDHVKKQDADAQNERPHEGKYIDWFCSGHGLPNAERDEEKRPRAASGIATFDIGIHILTISV